MILWEEKEVFAPLTNGQMAPWAEVEVEEEAEKLEVEAAHQVPEKVASDPCFQQNYHDVLGCPYERVHNEVA